MAGEAITIQSNLLTGSPLGGVHRTIARGANGELANLDALRAFAVGLVFFGHLFEILRLRFWGDLAHLGVLLFFVHTSLVLMLSMERLRLTGVSLYASFLVRRVFRIYPLCILAVLLTILLKIPIDSSSLQYHAPGWLTVLLNFLLLQNITQSPSVVGVLWSLPFEIQMYVLLPFLFLITRRHKSIWGIILIWLFSVSVAGGEYVARKGSCDIEFLLARYFPCFLAGIFAWRSLAIRKKTINGAYWIVFLMGLAVLYRLEDAVRVYGPGLIGGLAGKLRSDDRIWLPEYMDLVRDWAFCCLAGLAIPYFLEISNLWLNIATKSIAKYSYGIYLCHVPVMWLCFTRLHIASPTVGILLTLTLTSIVSFLLYRYLEEPGIQFGKRIAARFSYSDTILPLRSLSENAGHP
jgi:peptidoglycan/LPS O-acetylase OafA/YrhL